MADVGTPETLDAPAAPEHEHPEPTIAGVTVPMLGAMPRWADIVREANRRRIVVRLRQGPDQLPVRVDVAQRSGTETRLGDYAGFEQAFDAIDTYVEAYPLPGADALRTELRAFGRRLAILQPRDVARRPGQDWPLYRDYRDRLLPLAWDNLVDSVRVEAMETFIRKVGATETPAGHSKGATATLRELAAEARGLVAPTDGD